MYYGCTMRRSSDNRIQCWWIHYFSKWRWITKFIYFLKKIFDDFLGDPNSWCNCYIWIIDVKWSWNVFKTSLDFDHFVSSDCWYVLLRNIFSLSNSFVFIVRSGFILVLRSKSNCWRSSLNDQTRKYIWSRSFLFINQ
jgi:hypothetical protein